MEMTSTTGKIIFAIVSVIALLLALVVKKLLGRWVNNWVIAGGAVLLAWGLMEWIYRATVRVCY
ncbi:hypothetical protein [Aquitalea sp. FJL05]|uniref:hypothetical protein n=1 Tax=Aquitalea sp. FJL05 TaxID=2153366 RepID=UPI001F391DFB|nr:hypothetical protein [Aquitalea sp. FJL05]